MAWHGSSKTQAGRAILTGNQWLMLIKLAGDSEYWRTAHDFMKGINGHELSSLTVRQLDWYNTIEANLDVEINKREGRIAFGLEKESE